MDTLQLPSFVYKTTTRAGKDFIFDPLRKKYVCLTPEEWVRQHIINYLVYHLGYPPGLIAIECKAGRHKGSKHFQRADIFVYNPAIKLTMIVECKAPQQKLNHITIQQMARYNTQSVPFLLFSNGIQHFCFKISTHASAYELLAHIPDFHTIKQFSPFLKKTMPLSKV